MRPFELKRLLEGTSAPEKEEKPSIASRIGYILGIITALILINLVLVICWNYVMPIFGIPKLNLLQMAALYILIRILFIKIQGFR